MASTQKIEVIRDTREEVEAWWADYKVRAWGYDPSGRIVQRDDGKWAFVGSQYTSCD
ncbi:MAG: hypothetical protein RLZ51_1874 [Pseudomonadota bacterium]|jgi:hypothetical protein